MNTADRSVEALDTALRRRFVFEEMKPQPHLLNSYQRLKDLWVKNKHTYEDDLEWIAAEKNFIDLYGMSFLDKEEYENFKTDADKVEEQLAKVRPNDFKKVVVFSGVNLEDLLSTINNRLQSLLTTDHQIGHAWLMNVFSFSDLKAVFQNSILPLLKEYFYGDYGKIGLVVGKGFIEQKTEGHTKTAFADFDYDDSGLSEKPVYQVKNPLNMEDGELRDAIALLMNKAKPNS
jgi:5-methylcytosine-specific restriction protein B